MKQNLVFYDDATGIPVFQASLPDTFSARVKLSVEGQPGEQRIVYTAMAKDSASGMELYVQNGEGYTNNPETNSNFHQVCSAADQLDEMAVKFTGVQVVAVNRFYLPEERMAKVRQEGEKDISKTVASLSQTANMGQVPVNLTCTETLFDGAMGIYPFLADGSQKTLYTALWRHGFSIAISALGRIMSPGQNGYTTWVVPAVVYLVTDGQPDANTMGMFLEFIKTLEYSPQFIASSDQIADANISYNLNQAAMMTQQNQAVINQMWAQQNAAWSAVEAQRNQMSKDLDAFRQGLAANSAAMDAFHNNLHSMNQTPSFTGTGSGESLDDKVQRWRHESMMGVNTYDREDGTTYEHTIQDDRVFEHNLDSNTHFGTHDYYDDYVPDHWTELNRKQ